MNSQLATQSKAVTQCINQSIADDYIRRYQSSTKNALEYILCMGEAVYEIYQKVKSKELDNSDCLVVIKLLFERARELEAVLSDRTDWLDPNRSMDLLQWLTKQRLDTPFAY